MPRRFSALAALALCGSVAGAQTPAAPDRPTLVVLITIDGFRGDFLSRFGPQMTGGLARLTRGGAWFTNAHHDHGITETAPGHASLLSGRFPRSTGIAANRVGVADSNAPLLGFSGAAGASPARFQGTALFDWMYAADSKSRALSISGKDRGAILPIGKSKQEVYWYPGDGDFVTSRYYADSLPAWVREFNDQLLPHSYAGKSWIPLLPDSAYKEVDSVAVEGRGVNYAFPHRLPADPDQTASIIRATPFLDELIVAMALEGVTARNLGGGPSIDLLAISLSATDAVNHRLGPDSKEAHDQVLRNDRVIGMFLDSLFKLRDSSRVLVALSADHGFSTSPELAPAGVNPRPTRASLMPALAAARKRLKAAKVDTTAIEVDQQIVLVDRGKFSGAGIGPEVAIQVFEEAARGLPGIARLDRFANLVRDSATDPIARRWSHQFQPGTDVALVATLTPGSLWGDFLVASHGSPYDYDSHVPIIFYGPGIAPARRSEFVRTVDIAPTLAALLGVKPLEKLDGVPLSVR